MAGNFKRILKLNPIMIRAIVEQDSVESASTLVECYTTCTLIKPRVTVSTLLEWDSPISIYVISLIYVSCPVRCSPANHWHIRRRPLVTENTSIKNLLFNFDLQLFFCRSRTPRSGFSFPVEPATDHLPPTSTPKTQDSVQLCRPRTSPALLPWQRS
jgi:hypothetical protein